MSTITITNRLTRALLPVHLLQGPFFHSGETVDLYGPFWIVTTVIFLITATANFGDWYRFSPEEFEEEWKADFEKAALAATLFYASITMFPLGAYFVLHWIGTHKDLVELVAVYGYSHAVWLPAALLCMLPFNWWRWLCVLAASAGHTAFICRNVAGDVLFDSGGTLYYPVGDKKRAFVLVGCVAAASAGMSIFVKFLFY